MKIIHSLRGLLAITLFATATLAAHAQGPGNTGPNPNDPVAPSNPASPTQVPIDGGASVLLASGVAYGVRRLRQRHAR